MSAKKRIVAALGANVAGQAITVVLQLVSLPVFLNVWTLESYGHWLILTAIPSYFALSDLGFLAVTINKMTMLAAKGEVERTNVIFQTSLKFCLSAVMFALLLAVVLALAMHGNTLNSADNKAALTILVLTAVIAMSSGLIDAVFRSSGEFAFGAYVVNLARVVEWVGMICGLLLGKTFLSAAAGQLLGRTLAFVIGWRLAAYRHPHIQWSVKKASPAEFHEMVRPALSFMAFPIANAFNIQGMTLIVAHLFGPAFVAIFGTYRTISRILVQAVAVISRSLWPEISRQFGAGNIGAVMVLYRRGTVASIALGSCLCLFLYFAGESLITLWASGRVPFDKQMFDLFLFATTITSLWQTGMIVLTATNRHARLSVTYLCGSVASLGMTYLLAGIAGTKAPMIAMISFEMILAVMSFVHLRSFIQTAYRYGDEH